MDFFILDKLIINFLRRFMSDGVFQFSTLVGLWVISEAAVPSKKKKEHNK